MQIRSPSLKAILKPEVSINSTMRLIIIAIIVFCSACNKDYVNDFSKGKATAIKEKASWVAEGASRILDDSLLYITLEQKNNKGVTNDHVTFFIPNPPVQGKYPLVNGNPGITYSYNNAYQLRDQDIVIAFYNIRDSLQSYIDIKDFDLKTGWLTAEFSSLFVKDKAASLVTRVKYPDTLSFTKGRMEILVVQ